MFSVYGNIELDNIVEHLNSTHDTSKVEISYLDTMVKLENGKIVTDLYYKPTDRNNFLPFNSAHPYHCKKGLPYGQFLRLRGICSRDEDFLKQSAKKAALLLQKQYPMELLINSYLKLADAEISVLSFTHQGRHSEAALQMRLRLEFDWIHRCVAKYHWG